MEYVLETTAVERERRKKRPHRPSGNMSAETKPADVAGGRKALEAKGRRKKPRRSAPTFLQRNVGLFCLLGATGLWAVTLVPATSMPPGWQGLPAFCEKFIFLSYAKTFDKPMIVSEHYTVPPGTVVYERGVDDLYFIVGCGLLLTAARHVLQNFLFKPLVRYVFGQQKEMKVHKFAENAWQGLYYGTAWCTGFYIQWNSDWWFGGWTGLGGSENWTDNLWDGYPIVLHTKLMKLYYLVQAGFWFSMIFVTFIEEWRTDTVKMLIHHVITSNLVGFSYLTDHVRIGTAILVEQDFADIFLPIAKCFKYAKLPTVGDLFFVLFALAWYPTRHYVYFILLYTIWEDYPRIIGPEYSNWNPSEGYFIPEKMNLYFMVPLLALQVLLLI